MKALWVVVLIALVASVSFGQSFSEKNKAPYSRTTYGAASFKADSQYVFAGTSKWVTVKASYDTTASMGKAWFCTNDDSTNAIPLVPGIGGSYGEGKTFRVFGLKHYRIKGTGIPVCTTVE